MTTGGEPLTTEEMRDWAKERLATYKVPTVFRCVEALPRNSLGKVTKDRLRGVFDNSNAVSSGSTPASV